MAGVRPGDELVSWLVFVACLEYHSQNGLYRPGVSSPLRMVGNKSILVVALSSELRLRSIGGSKMETANMEILLAYSSAATRPFSSKDLADLLAVSRKNNEKRGITGMLLYIDESFFQILEGPEQALHTLYETITRDDRHSNVTKLIEEPIERRTFSDWSMGYAKATRAELSAIVGLNDFFSRGSSFNKLEPGRAKILLKAFGEGKWRKRLAK